MFNGVFEKIFLCLIKENQVMALKEKGIAAEYLSSTQATHVRNKVSWLYSVCVCMCMCICNVDKFSLLVEN